MSVTKARHRPLRLSGSAKHDVRTQFGALCWRVQKGEIQILLVTSRRSGRWIIPKGWPLDRMTPPAAAAREALEEAGAEGRVADVCLGIYAYTKDIGTDSALPCVVAVFPLKVKKLHENWPERSERKRKWFSRKKAGNLVESPELGRLIRTFDPGPLSE